MKKTVLKREPLGNKRFRWKQKDFVLSTFTCAATDMEKAMRNWAELGVNHVELGWATPERSWQAVDLCEKYGINLIFQDLSLMGGMMDRHMHRPVSEETIREVAAKLKDKKNTVGYYVWDEPFADNMFTEARRQSDILLDCDPDALLFSVFPPSYNPGPTWDTGEYAQRFEEYIQRLEPPVLSFDHYPIGDFWNLYPGYAYDDEKQLDNAIIWCDFGVARKLAQKYDLPFWFYYQACTLFKCTKKFEHSMVRMMMNAAVLYGAKGLQMYAASSSRDFGYITGDHVITREGEKGVFFEAQKALHQEFIRLGSTLMALSSKLVYHSSDLMPFERFAQHYQGLADSIDDSEILAGQLPQRTSVGELEDAYGNRYLFILNRDFYKELDAVLQLKGRYNLYEVSRQDGKQHLLESGAEQIKLRLDKGDAVLLRVQPHGEEEYLIEYTVDEQ